MWGGIITEVSFLSNFHVGFNNTKSDILIHLTQWQYWWWFWFSYFWVLYFLLFMRIFRFRVLKFKPRIATTYRPHGKWGDLIVCLLPVSWCVNIITNSNFILRMIEWQAESSLFTLRVRGKQWYWVYKYELKIVTDILTAPKNIGNNKWVISNPLDLQVADDYLHVHQLRSQSKWLKEYWDTYADTELKNSVNQGWNGVSIAQPDFFTNYSAQKSLNKIASTAPSLENFISELAIEEEDINIKQNPFLRNFWDRTQTAAKTSEQAADKGLSFKNLNFTQKTFTKENLFFDDDATFTPSSLYIHNKKGFSKNLTSPFVNFKGLESYSFGHSETHESFRWAKRGQSTVTPLRIIKFPLNFINEHKQDEVIELFRLRFNTELKQIEPKVNPHQTQWIFKQKRYKRLSSIKTKTRYYMDENGNFNKNIKFTYQPYVYKNRLILNDDKNYKIHYQLFKKTKKRNEDIKLPFNKRLLRTKRIVVLPAHVNLTVITNSFDVVHSWFIPGLGLKMDCIPGRSTHHVLHIDHVGFYYGQCAEICGRYHHHMPIRICALPFEHFLVWWHAFALPKLLKSNESKQFKYAYVSRKYIW